MLCAHEPRARNSFRSARGDGSSYRPEAAGGACLSNSCNRAVSAGLGAAIPILLLLAYNLGTTGQLLHPAYDYLYRLETAAYTGLGYRADWAVEDPRYLPQNAAIMFLAAVACNIAPAALIRIFSDDPAVIRVGDEYLRIISWNFVASGLVFVTSSMFQAMGNTIPSLLASISRLMIIAIPVVLLARLPGTRM